jgi:hypothetical protein
MRYILHIQSAQRKAVGAPVPIHGLGLTHRPSGPSEIIHGVYQTATPEIVPKTQRGASIVALEVKSGAPRHARSGLAAFRKEFVPRSAMLVGEGGMPLKEFFTSDPKDWL